MRLNFIVNGRLPSLNELIDANRRNRFIGAKFKRQWQEPLQEIIAAQSRGRKIKKHAICRIKFYEPYDRKHRKDDDNVISGGCKVILDAMTAVGVIKDDSPKYIHVIPERFTECDRCYTVIELEEDE